MSGRLGFLAIARTTFDVPFATETATGAYDALAGAGDMTIVGSPDLATTTEEVAGRMEALMGAGPDALVVFQATFADSSLISAVVSAVDLPIVLWATPEERTGERLRLNSFCGINLAAYVLARAGVDYRWVYRDVSDPAAPMEVAIAAASSVAVSPLAGDDSTATPRRPGPLAGKKIGLVGERPAGFEPCDFEPGPLLDTFGMTVDRIDLDTWFDTASAVGTEEVDRVDAEIRASMDGVGEVDQEALEASLRLYLGLESLAGSRGWQGVATRCWPECFTEFGGAACAGNSLLTSAGIPGCCEADVYGNVTSLLLQEMAGSPPLVADLIDLDRDTGTAVFWHCGIAPKEMAAQKPVATVHSNRRKPLLNQFPLRPGRITIARVSQSRGALRLMVGGGEMLDEPLPFSGTSGVAALDRPVEEALATIMGEGLEHHYGIVYGDHGEGLRLFAADAGLEVVAL